MATIDSDNRLKRLDVPDGLTRLYVTGLTAYNWIYLC